MGYDVIGDVHGQADKLEALLARLGYRRRPGTWVPPSGRQAVFVGDLIDRGPRQLDTVDLVRGMVDAGHARCVMGNHEFNAIAWLTEDPAAPGRFLRRRDGAIGARNRAQHAAFLAEVEHDPRRHRECVDWFAGLPLWLELPGLRVVHACWHAAHMAALEPRLDAQRRPDAALLAEAARRGTPAFAAVEAITKGIEAPLPDGHAFVDKGGHERRHVRVKWWAPGARTWREAAMMAPAQLAALPDLPVPADAGLVAYDDDVPVFCGHYWLTGTPSPQSPRVACVDYSAGLGGPLVAYRWDGEAELDAAKFELAG